MKTLIICPEHRTTGGNFQRMKPLALMPVLGRTLMDHALTHLKKAGQNEVIILASDRPEMIRESIGNGLKWGLKVEVIATPHELGPDVAELEHGQRKPGEPRPQVIVLDSIPGISSGQLWQNSLETFQTLLGALSDQKMAAALTMQEMSPGVWISTKARVSDSAVITAPAWIGPHVSIRAGAKIGPCAIIEADAFIDHDAIVENTWIGPATYVGAVTHLSNSCAWGNGLLNWQEDSFLEVTDSFLLHDLTRSTKAEKRASIIERSLALLLMLVTLPFAGAVMLRSRLRNEEVFNEKRVILPPPSRVDAFSRTYGLLRLNNTKGWLQRWPELLRVIGGEMALVGNRPLSPEEITALRGQVRTLWLDSPAGIFSLADAEGADSESVKDSLAHAAYFTSKRTLALRIRIFFRCLTLSLRKAFRRSSAETPSPSLPSPSSL